MFEALIKIEFGLLLVIGVICVLTYRNEILGVLARVSSKIPFMISRFYAARHDREYEKHIFNHIFNEIVSTAKQGKTVCVARYVLRDHKYQTGDDPVELMNRISARLKRAGYDVSHFSVSRRNAKMCPEIEFGISW